eukprot:GEMP01047068.1.p1 GENE.GEMP01047068.1~~GEMP01047068.1.p1  ORF type:complete len:270 (+),score=33.71 GEMP01047068.1:31-840(+)
MGIEIPWARTIFFHIPYVDIPVYNYGFWLACAFVAPWFCLDSEVKRKKLQVEPANVITLAIVFSLTASKIVMIILSDGWKWNSGHSFQAGVAGAITALLVYFRYIGQRLPPILDSCAVALPIGHAVGKIGCFTSADGCYGVRTEMPWGMSFPNGSIPTMEFVHPTPIYEGVLSFAIWAYLWTSRRSWKREMDQVWVMLSLLGGERVIMETIRGHPVEWYGLSIYQLWAVCTAMIGVVFFVVSRAFNWFPELAVEKNVEVTEKSEAKKEL